MARKEKVSKLDTVHDTQTPCAAPTRRNRPGKWRELLSDGLLLLGAGLLVLGAFLIWLPAGFFLAGGALMLIGWIVGVDGGGAG